MTMLLMLLMMMKMMIMMAMGQIWHLPTNHQVKLCRDILILGEQGKGDTTEL